MAMEELPASRVPAGDAGPPGRVPFETFVTVAGGRLLRTAYLLTRDHALAEDLLQTALLRSWSAWPRLDGAPEAYVRRVLVNTYASWWRRKWTGEHPTGDLPDGAGHDPIEGEAERRDVWDALGRLPRRQRAVVVLRYYEGLTEAETADVLGCSVGTVKSQASRALAKLRVDPGLGPAERTTERSPAQRATSRRDRR
jgi:RNA polymerase sigma-70 factor (sigma-E family)